MNRHLKILSALSLCFSVFLSLALLSACSQTLFDQKVLNRYHLNWFIPPEEAEDSLQENRRTYYSYEATIPSEDAFLEYVQEIFNRMTMDAYILGCFTGFAEGWEYEMQFPVHIVTFSEHLEDYRISSVTDSAYYRFFYTTQPLGAYDNTNQGYRIDQMKVLSIRFFYTATEPMRNFQITLSEIGHKEGDIYRIPENSSETAG